MTTYKLIGGIVITISGSVILGMNMMSDDVSFPIIELFIISLGIYQIFKVFRMKSSEQQKTVRS